MRKIAHHHAAGVGLAAVALITAGCSNGKSVDASPPPHAAASATSTSTVPAQYASATEAQKKELGKPLTGDHNAGTRQSGLVFQQFEGGVITAKNDAAGTRAYITSGKIRDAWNVQRDPNGLPAVTGNNGSAGPLGFPTSDATANGDLLVANFENGKIEYRERTDQVEVTVNGKVVPSGL
jgi:hypothetical protein